MKRLTLIFLTVILSTMFSAAQSKGGRDMKGGGLGINSSERSRMIESTLDVNSIPLNFKGLPDERIKEMERQMEERKWGSEDTAWELALSKDTRDAYQKYIALYPNGPHRAEASKRVVDIDVNNVFKGSHNKLPGMERVERDDDSPFSIVVVENATRYTLTVMYSGPESKSVYIPAGEKGSVKIPNGQYRIAASVPAPHVRPYAGAQLFEGGRYETGYCIVIR